MSKIQIFQLVIKAIEKPDRAREERKGSVDPRRGVLSCLGGTDLIGRTGSHLFSFRYSKCVVSLICAHFDFIFITVSGLGWTLKKPFR